MTKKDTQVALVVDPKAPATEEPTKEYYEDEVAPSVGWTSAISFADFDAEREAEEQAATARVLVDAYKQIADNIMWDPLVPDKGMALRNLADEMAARLKGPMSEDGAEPAEESLAEAVGGVQVDTIEEAEEDGKRGVWMDVQLISPGVGNPRDKRFYSAKVLREARELFTGVKQYETDHVEKERSTRSWVSTVKSVPRISEAGGLIGKVWVHDPGFATRMRNLKAGGLQEKMACSIKGAGLMRAGKVNGESVKIVESITQIQAVDWVTAAGRGGMVLDVQESINGDDDMAKNQTEERETEEQEAVVEEQDFEEADVAATEDATPEPLSASVVLKAVLESGLPDPLKLRLAERSYADADTLQAAIAEAGELVEAIRQDIAPAKAPDKIEGPKVSGLGQPPARTVSEKAASSVATRDADLAEREEIEDSILRRNHLI